MTVSPFISSSFAIKSHNASTASLHLLGLISGITLYVAGSQAKPDFLLADCVGGRLASKPSTVSSLKDLIQYYQSLINISIDYQWYFNENIKRQSIFM
jgi:hypothetical protein